MGWSSVCTARWFTRGSGGDPLGLRTTQHASCSKRWSQCSAGRGVPGSRIAAARWARPHRRRLRPWLAFGLGRLLEVPHLAGTFELPGIPSNSSRYSGSHAPCIWTGSISFGLVNVPVKLYQRRHPRTSPSTSSREHRRPHPQKRVSEKTAAEVPYEEIVKGYEVGKGQYVMVEPEELESSSPRPPARSRSRTSSTSTTSTRSTTTPPITSRRGEGEGVRRRTPAARGDGEGAEGRHRPLRDAHQAVPRRGAAV